MYYIHCYTTLQKTTYIANIRYFLKYMKWLFPRIGQNSPWIYTCKRLQPPWLGDVDVLGKHPWIVPQPHVTVGTLTLAMGWDRLGSRAGMGMGMGHRTLGICIQVHTPRTRGSPVVSPALWHSVDGWVLCVARDQRARRVYSGTSLTPGVPLNPSYIYTHYIHIYILVFPLPRL